MTNVTSNWAFEDFDCRLAPGKGNFNLIEYKEKALMLAKITGNVYLMLARSTLMALSYLHLS